MVIPCKQIVSVLEKKLKSQVFELKKKKKTIKLVIFLIGGTSEQLHFAKAKQSMAKRLGIKCELIHLKTVPPFEKFARLIKETSHNPETSGIVIQQPLPPQLSTESLFDFIDIHKEVEGHRKKTPFFPSLGMAVLMVCKYLFIHPKIDEKLFIDMKKDIMYLKKIFKHKKIVIIGRGMTGGRAIGKTLTETKINFVSTNSQTQDPHEYYKEADIIISAVGKKILSADVIKPGVVLIGVGMRKEGKTVKGDYDEREIKNLASYHTPTPCGMDPISTLYLFKNLIDAVPMQK